MEHFERRALLRTLSQKLSPKSEALTQTLSLQRGIESLVAASVSRRTLLKTAVMIAPLVSNFNPTIEAIAAENAPTVEEVRAQLGRSNPWWGPWLDGQGVPTIYDQNQAAHVYDQCFGTHVQEYARDKAQYALSIASPAARPFIGACNIAAATNESLAEQAAVGIERGGRSRADVDRIWNDPVLFYLELMQHMDDVMGGPAYEDKSQNNPELFSMLENNQIPALVGLVNKPGRPGDWYELLTNKRGEWINTVGFGSSEKVHESQVGLSYFPIPKEEFKHYPNLDKRLLTENDFFSLRPAGFDIQKARQLQQLLLGH